jgi:hypothetical protein
MRNTFNSLLYAFSIAPHMGGGQRQRGLRYERLYHVVANLESGSWPTFPKLARDWDYDYAELMA